MSKPTTARTASKRWYPDMDLKDEEVLLAA
jgi:hypothetical protein